jgi:hypothetical protein
MLILEMYQVKFIQSKTWPPGKVRTQILGFKFNFIQFSVSFIAEVDWER